MAAPILPLQEQIQHLNRIGISLTLEHDLQSLLELIVQEARTLARADGGSLYLVNGNKLTFTVAQNGTLDARLGDSQTTRASFQKHEIDITNTSLAGYVANTGLTLNIDDVYKLGEEVEYRFSSTFDDMNNYRSRSMLLVPMLDRGSEVAGVLCLLNAMSATDEVISFNEEYEPLLLSIASQAMAAIENARLIDKVKRSYLDTVFCLSMAAEARDNETGEHVRRISEYSSILSDRMGFSAEDVDSIRYASPLHDVGKIGIPDNILQKPGKLTDEEYEIMKTHTTIGASILEGDSEYIHVAKLIALTHHEKMDGKGYPNGLKGEEISIFGRIVAVADVFDALVSKRVYKPEMPVEKAKDIIVESTGTHFCPTVVEAFLKSLDDFIDAKARLTDTDQEADA
ncbi:MAG: HD domain-containing protein [Planctomycetota bacterium]|jgi:HD-GYP domain-containing protein (c-di-GMP phosphodiesterase class II)|nr:HD domain-containing protein [Planctomycetota bacterium]